MATRNGERLLTREDWTRAALRAIGEGGIAAVAVDRLATELGTTRGSFYWHFKNRQDLLVAALETWEKEGVTDVEAALAAVADPAQRLRAIFVTAFTHPAAADIEAALAARAADPLVAPALRRVTAARLRLLRRVFADLGYGERESDERARIFHVAYLGHCQARRGAPEVYADAAYAERLMEMLLGPAR
ncbi:TetR/AcrR family transcriptional regulator [Nonomuraea roseoviolacea subsp. roseoviolacea]|uniref:AcrR family transcriptional regulator n=1 Tax=Nonomuraea roseoviolacea subsp. carminata TaxID=160689 RepID=A0ABT1K794_9ACTN|nr:TetR family transcriptional regulator [Nonomuraea roseoviolacea]MCP2349572.1 AcrR family transcriptional regulator [Nonomuraea roseoviolacea subsp. carminata]